MKKKERLSRTIQVWGAVLIIGVAVSITAIDILGSYQDFKRHSEKTREDYIAQQKQIIKQEVRHAIDLIDYKKSQSETLTRKQIKTRVDEAYSVAQNIYQQNRSRKSQAEIQEMIFDALRPIRYAGGSGYYFATRLDGVELLFADKQEMEGLNLLAIQDTRGKYVVKDMIAIARQSGEGFYEYHWTKPRAAGNDFKKISFVRLFEPYDFFIGTGLYIDDMEAKIQKDLLKTIGRIRFGKEGYIFINHFNGDALLANGEVVSGTKKLWEVFNKNPEKTKELFAKEYAAAIKPAGDYIYYSLNKLTSPDRESPKASFIYGIPDLQWLIGAGVYLDDVENDIALLQTYLTGQIKKEIFIFSSIALAILSFFLFLFSRLNRKLKNDTSILISFFKQAAVSDKAIDQDLVHFDELDRMAENANKMLHDKTQAEKQLKMFRTFAESSNQGMGWAAVDGSIEYVNPALSALFGEEAQEAPIGKNVVATYYSEEERCRLKEEIFPCVLKDGGWSGELMLQKINGETIATHNSLFLIANELQEPLFFANIVTDISKWKKTEKDKAKLKEKLHIAQKMESIGLMAGGVAHDLNNILSGIIGYPELMLQNLPRDSELRKPIEAIRQSGQRAATVVADLLTVARGAAIIREDHDLNILVQEYLNSPECQKLMSLHPKVSYRSRLEAANSFISCSPVHVQKCIMNLVTNGCEAIIGAGTVSVATSNQSIDEKAAAEYEMVVGEYVVLAVEDTGSGISKENLEHIFEPFYTQKVLGKSGSGLGLAVVWNTMEDHDGKVLVESSENGTCFRLYFQVSRGKKNSDLQKDGEDLKKIPGKGEHILIVDDEPQLRDIARQMLESLDYGVDVVKSGEAAIEFVKKRPVDLLLMDMLMEPGMSGRQTYAEVTKLYPGQKVLIASGFSESADVRTILRLGAGGFIKKPYSMAQLSRSVRKVLDS